jgi:hypothetical protein
MEQSTYHIVGSQITLLEEEVGILSAHFYVCQLTNILSNTGQVLHCRILQSPLKPGMVLLHPAEGL